MPVRRAQPAVQPQDHFLIQQGLKLGMGQDPKRVKFCQDLVKDPTFSSFLRENHIPADDIIGISGRIIQSNIRPELSLHIHFSRGEITIPIADETNILFQVALYLSGSQENPPQLPLNAREKAPEGSSAPEGEAPAPRPQGESPPPHAGQSSAPQSGHLPPRPHPASTPQSGHLPPHHPQPNSGPVRGHLPPHAQDNDRIYRTIQREVIRSIAPLHERIGALEEENRRLGVESQAVLERLEENESDQEAEIARRVDDAIRPIREQLTDALEQNVQFQEGLQELQQERVENRRQIAQLNERIDREKAELQGNLPRIIDQRVENAVRPLREGLARQVAENRQLQAQIAELNQRQNRNHLAHERALRALEERFENAAANFPGLIDERVENAIRPLREVNRLLFRGLQTLQREFEGLRDQNATILERIENFERRINLSFLDFQERVLESNYQSKEQIETLFNYLETLEGDLERLSAQLQGLGQFGLVFSEAVFESFQALEQEIRRFQHFRSQPLREASISISVPASNAPHDAESAEESDSDDESASPIPFVPLISENRRFPQPRFFPGFDFFQSGSAFSPPPRPLSWREEYLRFFNLELPVSRRERIASLNDPRHSSSQVASRRRPPASFSRRRLSAQLAPQLPTFTFPNGFDPARIPEYLRSRALPRNLPVRFAPPQVGRSLSRDRTIRRPERAVRVVPHQVIRPPCRVGTIARAALKPLFFLLRLVSP